jgi:hypothetical protein
MNEIRVNYLQEDPVICASNSSINDMRKNLKILVGIMHETFDAWEYNQDGGLQLVLEWTTIQGLNSDWQ